MTRTLTILLYTLLVVGVVIGLLVWGYRAALLKPVVLQNTVAVDIPKGASFTQITTLLQQQVAIQPFWFKVIAFRYKLMGSLQAGEYEFNQGLTTLDILQLMAAGKCKQYTVTFPEGWSFKQMMQIVAKHPKLEHQLAVQTMPEVLKALGSDKAHAEGWFFPDTYSFSKGTNDIAILKQAHLKMQTVLEQEWQQKQPGLPLQTAYQALILASIIEKETGIEQERPKIAGVFTRRLTLGMPLQTDPTVIYGMGDSYRGNIRSKDLKAVTPYNTYVISGLPPTPIAMPGREAIHAALHPSDDKSLYFVADGSGGHYFSDTLAQHNAAVNKYQRRSAHATR